MFAVYSNNANNLTVNNTTVQVRLPKIGIYGGFSAVNNQTQFSN
jgi:hypothetical protein